MTVIINIVFEIWAWFYLKAEKSESIDKKLQYWRKLVGYHKQMQMKQITVMEWVSYWASEVLSKNACYRRVSFLDKVKKNCNDGGSYRLSF